MKKEPVILKADPDDPEDFDATREALDRGQIARLIRKTRTGLGLSQTEFARRFHVPTGTLRDFPLVHGGEGKRGLIADNEISILLPSCRKSCRRERETVRQKWGFTHAPPKIRDLIQIAAGIVFSATHVAALMATPH